MPPGSPRRSWWRRRRWASGWSAPRPRSATPGSRLPCRSPASCQAARGGAGRDLRRLRQRLGGRGRRRRAAQGPGGGGDLAGAAGRGPAAGRARGARAAGADALLRVAQRRPPQPGRRLRAAVRAGPGPLVARDDRRGRARARRCRRRRAAGPLPARGGDPVGACAARRHRPDQLGGGGHALWRARRHLPHDRRPGRPGGRHRRGARPGTRAGGTRRPAAAAVVSYQPYWALRAHLLARRGDPAAAAAYATAIGLAEDPAVKAFLLARAQACR